MKFDIFVISLDRAKERREKCIATLERYGLHPIIFPAVDGDKLTEAELSQTCINSNKQTINLALGRTVTISHAFSKREIGCALSHLRLYQKIVDENYAFALILEDDAILESPIVELIDTLKTWNNHQWDVIQLSRDSGIRTPFYSKKYKLSNNISLRQEGFGNYYLDSIFNRRRVFWLASTYFITPKACSHLINIGYPVRYAADFLLGHLASNRLKTLCPENNIYVKSVTDFESTISARDDYIIS